MWMESFIPTPQGLVPGRKGPVDSSHEPTEQACTVTPLPLRCEGASIQYRHIPQVGVRCRGAMMFLTGHWLHFHVTSKSSGWCQHNFGCMAENF
jgi:hypothetical protein